MTIDKDGMVVHTRILHERRPNIERGALTAVRGIIVHQTGGSNADSTLNSYKLVGAKGAHFLIEREGTIYQTASLKRKTMHVGALKARCVMDQRCTPAELKALKTFAPKAEHRRESLKQVPDRFPSNEDSIGIELVGELAGDSKRPDHEREYECVTNEQNDSLKWLVAELQMSLGLSLTEVFRHPDASRKNPTEASTARW
ncbi:MAG: peptidoglycan recognition protein family protein [Pseudomonas sp.]